MNGENYRAVVFNSARDGNLRRLNIFLEERSDEWLTDCLSAAPAGTPAIVIAARNGHVDVVRYLLAKGADVLVKGTVAFDGEVIPGAPALWAASAAGHLNVVRCLVEEGGANINQPTNSNSSPLRGACYDGHYGIAAYLIDRGADIEMANRHGHTPLMIAAFKMRVDVVKLLLERKADPLRSSARGNTAMHDAAEAGSEAITGMLLSAGAKNVADDFGVTPIMCAALAGHEAVLKQLAAVADPQHIRDAMKLYGATLVDKKMDLSAAIRVWSEAMAFGQSQGGFEPFEVYENQAEVDSLTDILGVVGDPDAIRMQALLIRERILGGFHHETHYFIRYRGAVFCDLGEVDRCFELWMHALQLQQKHLCALHPSTLSTISAFLDTFLLTVNEGIIIANAEIAVRLPPFSRSNVLKVLGATIDELNRYSDGDVRIRTEDTLEEVEDEDSCTDFLVLACLQLILIVSRLRPIESKAAEEEQLEEDVSFAMVLLERVRRLVRVCQQLDKSPLHAACEDIDRPVTQRFPSSFVIGLLIQAGVNLDCKHKDLTPCVRCLGLQLESMPAAESPLRLYRNKSHASLYSSTHISRKASQCSLCSESTEPFPISEVSVLFSASVQKTFDESKEEKSILMSLIPGARFKYPARLIACSVVANYQFVEGCASVTRFAVSQAKSWLTERVKTLTGFMQDAIDASQAQLLSDLARRYEMLIFDLLSGSSSRNCPCEPSGQPSKQEDPEDASQESSDSEGDQYSAATFEDISMRSSSKIQQRHSTN